VIYGEILAGGKGTRMGNLDMPKQFLTLQGKPIIIHTIEKFILNSRFDKILVATPKEWIHHTNDIISKWIGTEERIVVIQGGADRNETIMNGVRFIAETYGLCEEDVIVTHDAVRPFVTHRILQENIDAALEYGAVDTAIPAFDTIIEVGENGLITDIPIRDKMFQGQTPQSFNVKRLMEVYEGITPEQKAILTDACKMFVLRGHQVKVIRGEVFNGKITTPYDLKTAEALFEDKRVTK